MAFVRVEQRNARLAAPVRLDTVQGKDGPLGKGLVTAPGIYDMISAKIADGLGFSALYMTGYGVSASLGLPDAGLASYTEMVERVAQICQGTTTPVICDADTGFGGLLNVERTVQGYERAFSALAADGAFVVALLAAPGRAGLARRGEGVVALVGPVADHRLEDAHQLLGLEALDEIPAGGDEVAGGVGDLARRAVRDRPVRGPLVTEDVDLPNPHEPGQDAWRARGP